MRTSIVKKTERPQIKFVQSKNTTNEAAYNVKKIIDEAKRQAYSDMGLFF